MIPEHLYMTDLGKIAYVVLYLPMVLFLLWLIYRKIKSAKLFLVVPALVLLTLPFWDVYMVGRDADRLCRERGGLHVYKTVKAEGFLGGGGVERWLKYGFKYVENGGGDKMSRYTMQDGEVVHQRVQKFISQYQAKSGNYDKVVTKSISESSEKVVDLKSNEVLGELIWFNIYPGLFDQLLLRLVGSGPVLWHCGDEPQAGKKDALGYGDVVMAVIKPKLSEGEVQ